MSWGRGLFRLWIVFAVIWVAVVGAFANQGIFAPHYGGHVLTSGPEGVRSHDRYSDEAYDLERAKADGQLVAYEVEGIPNSLVYVSASLSQIEQGKRVTAAFIEAEYQMRKSLRASRAAAATQAGLAAIIPPLLILALGLAFAWAIRGFRAKEVGGD